MTSTPQALFIDTGAFYARIDEDDTNHHTATTLFKLIRAGDVPYRAVVTSRYVISELATLALYKLGHRSATTVLSSVLQSPSINVLSVRDSVFERAVEQFISYDDQQISFVDHVSGVLATNQNINHVFTFDDDFRTLGFTVVPTDVELPEITEK